MMLWPFLANTQSIKIESYTDFMKTRTWKLICCSSQSLRLWT